MEEERHSHRPVAGWFMIGAVASVLFMGLGCVTYLMHVLANPDAMALDERAAYLAEPAWVTGANAVAVWVGLAGAVLLVMKRRLAEPVLGASLAAVLVWLAGLLVVAPLRDAMSANDLIVALAVSAITWTIFWFARHSRQRGWLR
jgi:hypothetical protein